MYVQPFDGSLNPSPLATPGSNAEAEAALLQGSGTASAGDNISRFAPPWSNDGSVTAGYGGGYANAGSWQGLFGPLMGVLQQLMQMLGSLMGYGCTGSSGSPGCPQYGNERFFQNANGASSGDPHLSFNGAHWNNMSSQPDLLNSDSFAGGFRISTQVTPADGKGVTWNQSATVSMNGGATTVSMNDRGDASITSYGQQLSIAKGQTLQLGNGESVTYEQNGSLQVSAQNGFGGRIETTLTPQGKGVNVDVTAHDVDLGGALVNGYERQDGDPALVSGPSSGTIGGPVPTPIPGPYPVPTPIPGPYPIPEPIGSGPQPAY